MDKICHQNNKNINEILMLCSIFQTWIHEMVLDGSFSSTRHCSTFFLVPFSGMFD